MTRKARITFTAEQKLEYAKIMIPVTFLLRNEIINNEVYI